ncbi:MAG: T9SS type A sorting domain-containing protein, partial [Flavobacteriales bacterium]|nr:T9SS type A sorting domain-containing protein [Flavobacteriales bacterium]
EIIFAVMAFTSNPLGNALVAQNNNGISIQGIIDYVEFSGSEYDYLQSSGINVLDYQNADGTQWPDGPVFHHKYAITDYQPGSAHPAVISGSHNWTASANTINDENTLIIRDHEVANWFYQEFVQRWADLPNTLPELADVRTLIYPNPGADSFALHSDETANLSVYNLKGQLVLQSYITPGVNTVDVSSLPSGSYVVHISGNHTAFAKWIKQ